VTEPRVLSDLSNVIVWLAPAPVVARVATSTAAVRAGRGRDWLARDVAVAGFLAERGADVVPPASEPPPGPHVEDGLCLTFWPFVEFDPDHPPSGREAGAALRRLHETLDGFEGELPPCSTLLDECARLIDRLEESGLGAGPDGPRTAPNGPRTAPDARRTAPDALRAALAGARAAIDRAALGVRPWRRPP
jgi:hypothetical protein